MIDKIPEVPTPVAPDVRAVIALYASQIRGKHSLKFIDRVAAGAEISSFTEAYILRRLAGLIRKQIDKTTTPAVRARAKKAHMNGCLRTRVAAILGCTPYEAEVWANLSTPRRGNHPDDSETDHETVT